MRANKKLQKWIFHKWKIERVLDAGILKAQYSNSHC